MNHTVIDTRWHTQPDKELSETLKRLDSLAGSARREWARRANSGPVPGFLVQASKALARDFDDVKNLNDAAAILKDEVQRLNHLLLVKSGQFHNGCRHTLLAAREFEEAADWVKKSEGSRCA